MARKGRGPTPKRSWTELQPAIPRPTEAQVQFAEEHGVANLLDAETWINDRYVVTVRRRDGDASSVVHLSVRRHDRGTTIPWQDKQRIKNELAGEDAEAVELYPAESRLVDGANQYHLWCLPPGQRWPLGWQERQVGTPEEAEAIGAKQAPREEVSDDR